LTNFANFLGKISKCSIITNLKTKKKKRALEWIKHLWIENVLGDGHCENPALQDEMSLTNGNYVT
jgi:hypothetical protein